MLHAQAAEECPTAVIARDWKGILPHTCKCRFVHIYIYTHIYISIYIYIYEYLRACLSDNWALYSDQSAIGGASRHMPTQRGRSSKHGAAPLSIFGATPVPGS